MNKPRLLFVYDHPNPKRWMDGLDAALRLLEEDFEIVRHNIATDLTPDTKTQSLLPGNSEADFVLVWGAFGSLPDSAARFIGKDQKVGICIAGNATPPESSLRGIGKYDVLFHETKWYRQFIDFHPNIVHAFGINTDIFAPPTVPMPIVWDYIGVGAFAAWKRWHKMIEKGGRNLVVGELQQNNMPESMSIATTLLNGGVMISDQVSPLDLVTYYYWSRKLYMPSDVNGGGERAILEARACGLEVEIEDDNEKLRELVEMPTIQDHHLYAKQLKKGIMSVL